MADFAFEEATEGWLFRVITRGASLPRYFVVGAAEREEAQLLVETEPDVQGDRVEVVGRVSVLNMEQFEVRVGEVKQIDAPP
jgi:hypothetical protein